LGADGPRAAGADRQPRVDRRAAATRAFGGATRALEDVRAVAFGDASAYLLTLDFGDTAGAVAD
jgi:hypothetical protein